MTPAPLARPVVEQLKRTYPNRERPVRPTADQINAIQIATHDEWKPAPWFRPLAKPEQAKQSAAA